LVLASKPSSMARTGTGRILPRGLSRASCGRDVITTYLLVISSRKRGRGGVQDGSSCPVRN